VGCETIALLFLVLFSTKYLVRNYQLRRARPTYLSQPRDGGSNRDELHRAHDKVRSVEENMYTKSSHEIERDFYYVSYHRQTLTQDHPAVIMCGAQTLLQYNTTNQWPLFTWSYKKTKTTLFLGRPPYCLTTFGEVPLLWVLIFGQICVKHTTLTFLNGSTW